MKCHEIKVGKKYTDGCNIREVAEIANERVRYQFTHKGYERGRGKQGEFYTCRLQTFASWAKTVC